MKYWYLIVTVFTSILLFSCKNDSEKRLEYAKIVESRSTQDLLNDLYVGSDGDIQAIARIMNVTPSSIERIRNGETYPSDQFDERVHEVAIYYMQNDQKFEKLRSIVDPEYGWYDTVLNFPSLHPWWFWCGNIIILLIIIAIIVGSEEFHIGILGIILLEMLIFLIAWIASLIWTPTVIQDSYVDSINPTIEQIK